MHMINKKIECIYLEKFTGRDRTLTLEEGWKQKKNNHQNKKIGKTQNILVRLSPKRD